MPRVVGYKKPITSAKSINSPGGSHQGGIHVNMLALNGDYCFVKRTEQLQLIALAELSQRPITATWFNPLGEAVSTTATTTQPKTMTAGGGAT